MKTNFKFLIVFVLLVLFFVFLQTKVVEAVGDENIWVGSGGELFKFNKNPWFVKNTTQVKYCIQISQDEISARPETLQKVVAESIKYWTSEFSWFSRETPQTSDFGFGWGITPIATQDFVDVSPCDNKSSEDVDLKIKFGYNTLTDKEVQFIKDPSSYLGLAVRTDYDKKKMKGRGFIFVTSDLGPKAYHNPGNLISKAWENEKLLKLALIHEFGHLFGLPHHGNGIMSEVFLDQLLHVNFSKQHLRDPIPSFFSLPQSLRICRQSGQIDILLRWH